MITVKLFGLLKTLASHEADLSVALNGGSRVKDLVAVLQRSYPQISELIQKKTVLVAVNQEIAHEDTEIRDGDEVALLPPFAGGAAMGTNAPRDAMVARVQREECRADAGIDRVPRRLGGMGGISIF